MTSEEIKAINPAFLADSAWLKEIAYQLALMNERVPEAKPEIKPEPKKVMNAHSPRSNQQRS